MQVASATATFVMMFSSSLSVVEFYFLHRFPIPFGKSMALQVCLKFSIHFSMYGCSHSKNVHCFLYLKLAISSSFLYWLDSGASAWFERLCMCSREHRWLSSSSPLSSSPVLLQWVSAIFQAQWIVCLITDWIGNPIAAVLKLTQRKLLLVSCTGFLEKQ